MKPVSIPGITNEILQENIEQNKHFYDLLQFLLSLPAPVTKNEILAKNFDTKHKVTLYLRILVVAQLLTRTRDAYQLNPNVTIVDNLTDYPIFTRNGAKIYHYLVKNGSQALLTIAKENHLHYTTVCDEVEILAYFGVFNYINDGLKKMVYITDTGVLFQQFINRIYRNVFFDETAK